MSDLVTLETVRAYLRVQTTAEDDLLAVLIEQAQAEIESYIDRPIYRRELTVTDHGEMMRAYGVLTELVIPVTPVDVDSVAITDNEGNTVDDDTYTVDANTGLVRAINGTTFSAPPYAITCEVGLETRDDFEITIRPALSAVMLDLVADAYQRRSTAAQAEGSGGGVYTQWQMVGMPERAAMRLDKYRRVGAV